jgi:hypothetical protein
MRQLMQVRFLLSASNEKIAFESRKRECSGAFLMSVKEVLKHESLVFVYGEIVFDHIILYRIGERL